MGAFCLWVLYQTYIKTKNILYNKQMIPLFVLKGIVQEGKKRGKKLGFPTANIKSTSDLAPGIYISEAILSGDTHQAITFMGTADTFGDKDFTVETYILDFDKDIYGEYLEVRILKKLRDGKKFESEEELIEQMQKDESATRDYFEKFYEK